MIYTLINEVVGSNLGRARDFSLLHGVQTDSGSHLASCPMVTGKNGRSLKLSTYLEPVPRLMCGAMPPFPHASSWLNA
jgi:hypothetical protein